MNLDTIQELGPESMEVLNGLDLDPETLESVKQWIEIEKTLDVEKFMGQEISAENIMSTEYGPVAQQALDDSGATVDSFAMKDASTFQSTIKVNLPGMDRPLEGLASYNIENNGAVMHTGVQLTSNPMGDWADSLTPEQADAIFGLKDLPSGLSDINTAVDSTAQNLLKAVAVPAGVVAIKSSDEAVQELQKRAKETKESFVHPQWKTLLSEEIGPEFDAFAKEYGDEVAVYAMFEWYNKWIKEHTIVLEGFEHLQEYKLVENIESLLKEAPGDEEQASLVPAAGTSAPPATPAGAGVQDTGKEKGGVVRGIGKAFRKATGAIGKGVAGAVGGAVNVLVKPILNSAPVKGFLNKIQQAVGMQGAIDPAKLEAENKALSTQGGLRKSLEKDPLFAEYQKAYDDPKHPLHDKVCLLYTSPSPRDRG